VQSIAAHYGVSLETPWQDLPQSFRDVLFYGSGDEKVRFTYNAEWSEGTYNSESVRTVKGIVHHVDRLFHQTSSELTRRWYASFMSEQPCPTCKGARLRPEAGAVTVGGTTLPSVSRLSIAEAYAWVERLYGGFGDASSSEDSNGSALTGEQFEIAGEVLKEIRDRLRFMLNVGLHYLTLDRPAPTLSGGEGQRIRLASQLGCGLVGVLYILDEPSIGLHPRDNRALIHTLLRLRDMGNTVLVVEHDAEMLQSADWLIDLGPGAGILGGEIVAAGTPRAVAADPRSLTGQYLSGARSVAPAHPVRRAPGASWLTLSGARLNNLKTVTARIPLGLFTCITGVSGSGKSSLIAKTLHPALARALHNAQETPGPYDYLDGLEQLDKIVNVTQDPIGRTPRSNPATYTKLFDEIRRIFAATPDARARGYKADRFSFNVKGGRCEACMGHGQRKIEMHFLADVWVTCRDCGGRRFNAETLAITYKGKSIADVLDMDVQEALAFFANLPTAARVLQTLHDVGLDYVKLGQSALTFSGGEAQRIKLAKELSHISTGRTLYILDEPTTGLHFADIARLLDVLHRLVEAGNTVVVVEHNLDVIQSADWLLDLGPEGGADGGHLLAEGPPEDVACVEASFTGQWLRAALADAVPQEVAV
jgi:excinuclease ABC subunit A